MLVEIIRFPNVAYFVPDGTFDDGSQLPSEYDDIQDVDGWHDKEFFSS